MSLQEPMDTRLTDDRNDLAKFLDTADYQGAVKAIRVLLRRHLIEVLGGNWDTIHNEYGMYTINCRVKSVRRTLQKFDEMRTKGRNVNVSNFFSHMPDLAAGRLVVVDPEDLFGLAERVRAGCVSPLFEGPAESFRPYRVRHGKFSMYDTALFQRAGYAVEVEPTGYCSVHFVLRPGAAFFKEQCHSEEITAIKRLDADGRIPLSSWHVEIQVRTIMDEAWGETDHFVRYEDANLRNDPELTSQFTALAAYLQAANHHVSVIRQTARRKRKQDDETRD